MDNKSIRGFIDEIIAGQIRIPAFQRGFVWEPERVAQLMDSIYKKYPFGALLFWRTKERLKAERKLGPFELPKPREDYPLDYVLDGQQRITSIFGVFQTFLEFPAESEWKEIYFDAEADDNPQDTQFFALNQQEVDPKRHFPLRVLFDTVGYLKFTEPFQHDARLLNRIDAMQAVFKEVQIPVQIFKTENKSMVAIIFERINRQGVPLDTIQLLSAWTWSEEFHLQREFEDLSGDLEEYGFGDQQSEENLLLRCTAGILVSDPAPDSLINLNGSVVRQRFDEVVNGIKGALDFLRSNLKVEKISNLPFQTILIPLSVLFAVPGRKSVILTKPQKEQVCRWFWRLCFARRYSSGVLRKLQNDIKEALKLRAGQPNSLDDIDISIRPDFFTENRFTMSSVNTKTFILMLAQNNPLSFISGSPVDLAQKLKEYNRAEYHHLMPRAFLEQQNIASPDPSSLVNFAFLSSIENKVIGGVAPSQYRARMPANADEILASALCTDTLFGDNFSDFATERAGLLTKFAQKLLS